MVISGISDKVQVLKETSYGDGGAAGEKVFGITEKFEWRVDTHSAQVYGLESAGPGATANSDGVLEVSGSHEWLVTDGRELEGIMGTLTGTGTYTLALAVALPSYSVKAVEDDSNFVIIKGIKYGKMSVSMARDQPIKITAEWTGKTVETTTTFTPTVTAKEPLMYLDGYFKVATTNQTGVEDLNLEITRVLNPRRFVESTAANSRRLISSLVEGPLTLTYSGTMAAQRAVLQEIWGSTSIQDVRTDKAMSILVARGTVSFTLALTGCRHVTMGRPMEKNQEISLCDFSGVALSLSGTGTYS
jgi:hypothetical protein